MKFKDAVGLLTEGEVRRCDDLMWAIETVLTKRYGEQHVLSNWIVVALERLLVDIIGRAR